MEYSSAIKKEKLNYCYTWPLAYVSREKWEKKPVLQSYVFYDSIYITFMK